MIDILNKVRGKLLERPGSLSHVSRESGVGYMIVLRIRNFPDYEPGFRKVIKLAEYFKIDPCKME